MRTLEFLDKLRRRDRHSRIYLFGGKLRASTVALLVAFIALYWVNQTYAPEPAATPRDSTEQVVPPGFVPDPNYTWVPRTNVAPRETTTTTTTTPTTTTPSPTPVPTSGSGGVTTSPSTTGSEPGGATTTVIDPDGSGPLGPITFTEAPPQLAPTSVPPPGAPTITTPVPPQ
ncbi:hypothetical protein GR927_20830 [Mycolicibacterium sp. 3033]|nr:hypothetical protein [Mycolicibacterium aurantiacum]